MGLRKTPLLIVSAMALVAPLGGCREIHQEPSNPLSGPVKPLEGGVRRADLGKAQTEGIYTITLTAPSGVQPGPNRFLARVEQNKQPAQNVMVNLTLTRPSMNAAGPSVAMKKTGPGTFAASATVDQNKDWLAQVTVVGQPETDSAFFNLSPGEKPNSGTETPTSVQTGAPRIKPIPGAPGQFGNGQSSSGS